jgi:hypothetical protein
MAAVSSSYTIAPTKRRLRPGRAAAPFAMAGLAALVLIRLTGQATDAAAVKNLQRPSRLAGLVLRQPPGIIVKPVALEGSSRDACVMVLGNNAKLFVGSGDPNRDVVVSLPACDLYNASREPHSTKLVGGASLAARNIFLSGGYALAAGSLLTASHYLTTHTSPTANPYARLTIPAYSGCTRSGYKLGAGETEDISPGVFCGGIEVTGGATLNLDPGTYILDGGNLAVGVNATVKGAGVTIILTSRAGSSYGAIDIRAGSTIAIGAPGADTVAGVPGIALWVDERAPPESDILEGGAAQNINGAVYLPGRAVRYSGGSSSGTRCNQLVALSVTFTGNSYFRHDCAGAGLSDPAPPPLVVEESPF